jgi:hypothetical protein
MPPKTYGRQKSSETISTSSSSFSSGKSSVMTGGKKMSSLSSVSYPSTELELMGSYNPPSNSLFLHLSSRPYRRLLLDRQAQALALGLI